MPKEQRGNDTHLRLRVREDLLKQLQESAEQGGRTLTNEITKRLEQSLVGERRLEEAFGGPENLALFQILGGELGLQKANPWADSQEARAHAARVVGSVLIHKLPGLRSIAIEMAAEDGSPGYRIKVYNSVETMHEGSAAQNQGNETETLVSLGVPSIRSEDLK